MGKKKKVKDEPAIENKLRIYVRKFIKFNEHLCKKLNRSQKLFYVGIWAMLFTFFANFVAPIEFVRVWLVITFFVFICGIISDLLFIYDKLWKTHLGKGVILIIYAFTLNFAYAFSSVIVNDVVMFQSLSLTYTVNFVAILLIPLIAILLSFVVFGVFIIISQLYAVIAITISDMKPIECLKGLVPDKVENYFKTTLVLRILIYSSAFGAISAIAKSSMPKYEEFIYSATKSFIYHLEAIQHSRCSLEPGEKSIIVSDEEIVVVSKTKGKYSFKPQLCKPKLLGMKEK